MMQTTNMKENGLEQLIVDYLVAQNGYEQGTNSDYNKEYVIDEVRLFRFLKDTQEDALRELHLTDDAAAKEKFLKELRQQLGSKVKGEGGVVKLLRDGIRYLHKTLTLYNSLPTKENEKAVEAYKQNIFSVTRQVRYSQQQPNLALDFVVFINGLPKIEDDPEFEKKRSDKKLRAFVEGNKYTIQKKAEIMVNHFFNQVVSKGKMGGKARAMVVTASIESDAALAKVILSYMKSNMELFKHFQDDPSFKGWLQDYVFQSTYARV